MKYNIDNILVLLQDIQRHTFGKVTMFINAFAATEDCEEIDRMISVCVFDTDDKAKTFTFSPHYTDEQNKDAFTSMKKIVDSVK